MQSEENKESAQGLYFTFTPCDLNRNESRSKPFQVLQDWFCNKNASCGVLDDVSFRLRQILQTERRFVRAPFRIIRIFKKLHRKHKIFFTVKRPALHHLIQTRGTNPDISLQRLEIVSSVRNKPHGKKKFTSSCGIEVFHANCGFQKKEKSLKMNRKPRNWYKLHTPMLSGYGVSL